MELAAGELNEQPQVDVRQVIQKLNEASMHREGRDELKKLVALLLRLSKIEPTPIRISLLLLFVVESKRLTLTQVQELARKEFSSISKSVVAATLRLFKARHLLKEVEESRFRTRRDRARGRPEVEMYFLGNHLHPND